VTRNYKDAAVGKRIRLLDEMNNPNSSWMPKEDLPVGLEGTITYVSIHGSHLDQIGVNWDNGRVLGILPYKDNYEVYEANS
jgi:hypothetical protein